MIRPPLSAALHALLDAYMIAVGAERNPTWKARVDAARRALEERIALELAASYQNGKNAR